MIFAPKIDKIPEFYMILARKKIFSRFLRGWDVPPVPSPTPMGKSGYLL